jgi:hypothetical protein
MCRLQIPVSLSVEIQIDVRIGQSRSRGIKTDGSKICNIIKNVEVLEGDRFVLCWMRNVPVDQIKCREGKKVLLIVGGH